MVIEEVKEDKKEEKPAAKGKQQKQKEQEEQKKQEKEQKKPEDKVRIYVRKLQRSGKFRGQLFSTSTEGLTAAVTSTKVSPAGHVPWLQRP